MTGQIYGIGVGPGDPELMTCKAVRLLRECQVVGIPAETAEVCIAYQIALAAVPEIAEKELVCVPIPMTMDRERLAEAYETGTEQLLALLQTGKSIGFLILGDPCIYSTYLELHKRLQQRGINSRLVSGVPSFCASAAALGMGLVSGREELRIVPGVHHPQELVFDGGTTVLMKSGGSLAQIRERLAALQEAGEIRASAVVNCGMPGQVCCPDITRLDQEAGYFTTILVKKGDTGEGLIYAGRTDGEGNEAGGTAGAGGIGAGSAALSF